MIPDAVGARSAAVSRPFLVCIHDASPAFARETRLMLRELAPLVDRRLSFAVVPDWHGEWPLAEHRDYCALVRESAGELLLHGYRHQRRHGRSGISWLVEGSDEMSGLDASATRRTIERGQRAFTDVFGAPAHGFVAPAWQRGHVGRGAVTADGLDHVMGFFSIDSRAGQRVPLATWTWHCGRWGWLGHVGHGLGRLLQTLDGRIPALAIHPRDIANGFWPKIMRLTRRLLEAGYEPTTPAALLGVTRC